MKSCFPVLLILLVSAPALAQEPTDNQKIGISVTANMRIRSTLMNFFDVKHVREDFLVNYDYERAYQTIGLGPGVKIGNRYCVSYTPYLRYGYKYSYIENHKTTEEKGFSLDHQFYLIKNIQTENKWFVPDAYYVGYGIVHTGEKYFLQNGPINQVIEVEARTFDVGIDFKSKNKKLVYAVGAHYLFDGMTSNRVDTFICYSFTLGYELFRLPSRQTSSK